MATKTETSQLNPRRGRTCHRRLEDEDERELIAKKRKEGRRVSAEEFRKMSYLYCRCKDYKTCISSGGYRHTWLADSCGITWAGVHGENWICVVTKTGDLDVSRVHGYMRLEEDDDALRKFRSAAISELEDLADTSSELHRKLGKRIKAPFGVVSEAAFPGKVHKVRCKYEESNYMKLMVEGLIREIEGASSDESEIDEEFDEDDYDAYTKYVVKLTRRSWRNGRVNNPDFDVRKGIWVIQREMKKEEMNRAAARRTRTINESVEESRCDAIKKAKDLQKKKENALKAVKFLQKEMKKPVNYFTPNETVKTAISAFQRLCNTNFNANEIQVSVMDPNYFIKPSEDWFKDVYVKHLETAEIEKYLSDMKDLTEEWMPSDNHLGKRPKRKQIGSSKCTT